MEGIVKILIVEDDYISRRNLKELLADLGKCDIAINGQEAIDSFIHAHQIKQPYELICMDLMMPVIDGMAALQSIRQQEREMKIPPALTVKVLMTTAVDDPHTVIRSFYEGEATSYIVKPVTRQKLVKELNQLKLMA
jgi:two-component system chemotaxis response regulator CheY